MLRSLLFCVIFVFLLCTEGRAEAGNRQIIIGAQALQLERFAAQELQRYLWQVSGTFLEISTAETPPSGSFILGQRKTNPLIDKLTKDGRLSLSSENPGQQGYVLKRVRVKERDLYIIGGSDPEGCLYGVYGLLEDHFGLTFGLAGDVLPDVQKSLDLPSLDERHAPSVPVRGILPWSNWPQTTTSYSWADWKAVIDQMAKMRMNMLMVHNYADELYHNVPIDGKLPRVYLPHTKSGYMIGHPAWFPWAYRFKGRDLIDDCSFGAESSLHGESFSNEEVYARGVAMFRRVIAYAHTRGVRIALGVDINDTVKGKGKLNDAQRAKLALEPDFVKARAAQIIKDYPELDYFIAFCSEGVPQFKDTAPEWHNAIRTLRDAFKARAPGIKLAISGWGQRAEYIDGLPEDVIVAPIAPYKAYAQDGAIAGSRDFWAGPWMEKDNDDSMFYMPYRVLLSATVESWQKRSANTKGLYALTWRSTDAIDAKFWYLARAPWDAQNKMKTGKDAYYAYAVANYGKEAADLVTPIINENEAFASNMCEMGGPRPFREFATIMAARHEVNMKGFSIPSQTGVGYAIEAVKYHHRTGGGAVKAGTPEAYMQMSSGLCLEFRNVDFGEGTQEIRMQLAAPDGARVECRLNNADGPLLGQAVVPKTKDGEDFTTVILPVKSTKGKQTIVFNFSKEVYPRKELAKAEEQIAIVDQAMAKASPTQRQRLDLLRTRLCAVRDHIRLNLEFPDYTLDTLPGAMESWVMNYIRRVDDISSLGTMTSIQNRFVQHTYLRKKVEPFYERQAIRPPLDVEARGTPTGAQIIWAETDSSGKVKGYRVYRDGKRLNTKDLPATADCFSDEGSGEFQYTVTAVGADNKESLPSVKSRCLAGTADNEAPFIVMVSPPQTGLRGQPVVIKARVIDNRAYNTLAATVRLRSFGSKEWRSLPMTRKVRGVFTLEIPPAAIAEKGADYYIEASDGSNIGHFPLAAPQRTLSVVLEQGPAPSPLKAPAVRADKQALTWTASPSAYWYRIYRGRTPDFRIGPESYLTYAPKEASSFTDMEEDFDGRPRASVCYYRVTAMDGAGYESEPSEAIPVRSSIILPLQSATLLGRPQLRKLREALTTSGSVLSDFGKQAGDSILFKNIPSASALRIRYSNGNSKPRQCGLYVSDTRVATLTFPVSELSDGAENYADGVRLTQAKGAAGDWNTFRFLELKIPIQGVLAFRIDGEDFNANGGEVCCMIDRIELEPDTVESVSAPLTAQAGTPAPAAEPPIQTPVDSQQPQALAVTPFDLQDVQLLASPFKTAQHANHELLLRIDLDRLLHPFRREAGLPSPLKSAPNDYNYANTGHITGHFLSGCALEYRNTGDKAIKARADQVVAVLAECQEKIGTGYLGGFSEQSMLAHMRLVEPAKGQMGAGVPWYCLHKIYAGLLDMYVLTGNNQAKEVAVKVADWCVTQLDRMSDPTIQNMLNTEHGGISEFFANLYDITRDPRYLRAAERLLQRGYLDAFARGEGKLVRHHANTQIPKISSAERVWQMGKNMTNHLATLTFFDNVAQGHTYVTGGNSYAEYFGKADELSFYLGSRNTEACNTYNMLKLARYLFMTQPRCVYADYYERSLYNHILSTKHPEHGGQLYFLPLQSGHTKGGDKSSASILGWRFPFNEPPTCSVQMPGSPTACCSGSSMESNAKYADSIYFHSGSQDLYVNLFIPSALTWKTNGVCLVQNTTYPLTPSTRLELTCERPVRFTLHLRRPWWATEKLSVRVNGDLQAVEAKAGDYLRLERLWKQGDAVEVVFPMSLRTEGFADNPQRVAFMYGPLVMAAETEKGNPFSVALAPKEDLLKSFKPVEGSPLTFTASADIFRTSPDAVRTTPVVFRPLAYLFDETPYAVYWDLHTRQSLEKAFSELSNELKRQKDMDSSTSDMLLFFMRGDESFSFQSQLLTQPGWLARGAKSTMPEAHKMKTYVARRRSLSWLVSVMPFQYVCHALLLEPESWASFTMQVKPGKSQALQLTFWKSLCNTGNTLLAQGTLEVYVNGTVLSRIDASALPAGRFTTCTFDLPDTMTATESTLAVKLLVPKESEAVSGIYECRIVDK